MFGVCVTAEGTEAPIEHLATISEGSGPENVSDLRLSSLSTGAFLPYPFQFITDESVFHYECDVIYFFRFCTQLSS